MKWLNRIIDNPPPAPVLDDEAEDTRHPVIIHPPGPDGRRAVTLADMTEEIPVQPAPGDWEPQQHSDAEPETLITITGDSHTGRAGVLNPPIDTDPLSTHPTPTHTPAPTCGSCGQAVPSDAEVLSATLEAIHAAGVYEQLIPRFYEQFFALRQETRGMFPPGMTAQNEVVLAAITALCQHYGDHPGNSDDPDLLDRQLATMGRDHIRFNLSPYDYADMGTAMLGTIRHFLGTGWTPHVQSAWERAYKYLMGGMLQAEARR